MKTFVVAIEETTVQEFRIEANNQAEALARAKELYHSGELVLSPGEVHSKQISLLSSTPTEWNPF